MTRSDLRRGDIWRIDLDPTIGSEIRKIRPCLIISRTGVGKLALCVVVPLTGWQDPFATSPWCVRVEPMPSNGLIKTSAADAFQVRSVSTERLLTKIGSVSDDVVDSIVDAVNFVIAPLPAV